MSDEVIGYTSAGGPDPADPAAVVAFIVGLMRVYGGGSPYYDEAAMRAIAERDIARTANIASCLTNHFVMDFASRTAIVWARFTFPPLWCTASAIR